MEPHPVILPVAGSLRKRCDRLGNLVCRGGGPLPSLIRPLPPPVHHALVDSLCPSPAQAPRSGSETGPGTGPSAGDSGRLRALTTRSIQDVIDDLGGIISLCRAEKNPAGYFPALYRRVTLGVQGWIAQDRFDDGPRMERLDVVFADRYLDAWRAWRAGGALTRSWAVAFEAAEDWAPTTVQHLLLGINAHINLDLGIAAARVSPPRELAALGDDFGRINQLLASLVDDVQDRLSEVWPLLRVLDWAAGGDDEATVNFSMGRARDAAWGFAHRLAARPGREWPRLIQETDELVAAIGGRLRHPGPLLGAVTRLVRLGELRSRARVIDLLS